ncbi:DUF4082 domain-containing protein [Kribbella deserti]|uniref:DUF4082 domain-containing protein n=1 Tax=Kribbella deserti TaxID=1926257 RepID=A0ABV6QWY4_9ACTN
MPEIARRHFLSLSGGVVAAGLLTGQAGSAFATPAAVNAAPPPTIPALQSWTAAATGSFSLGADARIRIDSAAAAELQVTGEVFSADLRSFGRTTTVVVEAAPVANAGDIRLKLASIPGLGAEGYEIQVGSAIEIRGSRKGIFNGTRTVLQWLRNGTQVPAGLARDWPRFAERGFLVANAPKTYSRAWWSGQIREMSYLKLNMLWLYVGYDTTPLALMKDIAAEAARYNITVIPQSNMPGHMTKLLVGHENYALPGRADALDLSNQAAWDYAKGIVTGLTAEFDTPYWHLGSDEYLVDFVPPNFDVRYDLFPQLGQRAKALYGASAVPPDLFYGFINDVNASVRAGGKTMRVWNDGLLVQGTRPISKDIVVEHWVHWPNRKTPQQLADEGYKLSNSNGDYLYYDPGTRRPEPKPIYESFRVGLFANGQAVAENNPALLGAKISLWTLPDVEEEEYQAYRLVEPFRAFSQVLWGSPKPAATYEGFEPLIRQLGRAPGFPALQHSISPVAGATSVWPHRVISVRFYDDVDPASIQLGVSRNQAPTPGTTRYDAATKTATFTPSQPWPYDATIDVRLVAKDTSGRAMAPRSWSFQAAKAPSTDYPRSIWPDEAGPAVESYTQAGAVELGVKFRSDRDGLVRGIRFFKGPKDTATHTGTLWSPAGAVLATGTFTNESPAGWQELRFGTPVRISANTTYTASRKSPNGTYGYNYDYFAGREAHNGVLHGSMGVFGQGAGMPTESFRATNYWTDVVFEPDVHTVWDNADVPAIRQDDVHTLELGMKFQVVSAGVIVGLRFYKAEGDTGTHVGKLWSATGALLAQATFTGERAYGWHEVRLATPVRLTPGTTYVASYNTPNGIYGATAGAFATTKQNGALRGQDSVFRIGEGGFPTESYNRTNYFADVLFDKD